MCCDRPQALVSEANLFLITHSFRRLKLLLEGFLGDWRSSPSFSRIR